MQPDNFQTVRTARVMSVDAGLRAHMQRIYNRMTLGVLVTAIVAWFVGSTPPLLQLLMGGPQAFIFIFAPIAVMWFGFNPATMPVGRLRFTFFLLSALYGISLSVLLIMYAKTDIARALFIATGMFAGLSVFGYLTKKNLDGLGSFAVMGAWGAFILGMVNLFVQSGPLSNLISVVAIISFAGITAWQTQTMKESYHPSYGEEANERMSWSAALTLYLSFIVLFQNILHLIGNRN